MSLFNAFYDTYCYLPIVGCLSFDREPEQYLVAALLRDGEAPAKAGLPLVLKRLRPLLREAFPRAKLRIRLDAGFAGEELLEYFDREGLESSVCLASHAVLKREAEPWMGPVRQQYEA